MLELLVFLFWAVVFCRPLALLAFKAFRGADIEDSEWKKTLLLAIGGGVLIIILSWTLSLWTDFMWFEEVGYTKRFWTILSTKWFLFLLGYSMTGIFVWANFLPSMRAKYLTLPSKISKEFTEPKFVYVFAACILSIISGFVFMNEYDEFLLWKNQTSFGSVDPVFGKDLGFFVFSLPIISFVINWLMLVALATIVIVCILYATHFIRFERDVDGQFNREITDAFKKSQQKLIFTHAAGMGAFFLLLLALNFGVGIWKIVFSNNGVFYGAGNTDLNVVIMANQVMMAGLVLFAVMLHTLTKLNISLKGPIVGICALFLLRFFAPMIYQAYSVSPNQLEKERPYIERNILATKKAYGLTDDKIQATDFIPTNTLSRNILQKDKVTLDNVRIWDYRVLLSANYQYQGFRPYYAFSDVDIVRYKLDGKMTQLMYSAREIDTEKLVENSKTWQNVHLVYTHGFGAVANPVNAFADEGRPDYWLKDIPSKAKYPELQANQPRIYFGEKTDTHVYVKTKHPEFDYPEGDQNKTFFYDGPGGVRIGTWFRKFAIAYEFDGLRFLTAQEITPESRIMFRRNVKKRIAEIAPFLKYETDIYQVAGRDYLWYIQDAYTTSTMYPYSTPHGDSKNNYVRNSVKVVVNAYTGSVDFYIIDETDPIIKTYNRIFPGLFKPLSAMPAEIRQHLRYPEELLNIQGSIYATYHMTNPDVFYNKEDAWQPSRENSHEKVQPIEAYYTVMRLPSEKHEEFILMLPFSPFTTDEKHQRDNMVSWLAARCDGENYGKLVLCKFPKDHLINGPLQISMRINQDEVISKDFTLWNQQGSKVLTGNLMVIPLSDNQLIYVQPVYLQSDIGKMPELKRVVVATGDRIGYATTFEAALEQILGGSKTSVSSAKSTQTIDKKSLIQEAVKSFETYRTYTGQGKLIEAGQEMDKLNKALQLLLKEDK